MKIADSSAARRKTMRPRRSDVRNAGTGRNTHSSLVAAVLGAAEQVGEDNRGKDGLVGYLRRLAVTRPVAFAGLLRLVLPLQTESDHVAEPVVFETVDEVKAELVRRGLPPIAALLDDDELEREYLLRKGHSPRI